MGEKKPALQVRKPFKLKHNKIEFARRNHHNLKNGHKFAVFGWGVNKVSLDCIISACRYDEYRERLAPFCFFLRKMHYKIMPKETYK